MLEDMQGQNPNSVSNPPSTSAPVQVTDANVGEAAPSVKTFDEAYVKELRAEAAKHRKEKQEIADRLAALETSSKQQEEKKLTEQQEWQKLAEKRAAELEAMKSEMESIRLGSLRTMIGVEFKLPAVIAKLLTGANEDEIRANAKAIATELKLDQPAIEPPKPEAAQTSAQSVSPFTPARSQTTAPVPGGQVSGETDEQRRARLYKRGAANSPLFNPKS
jgi:hypothetical protein